MYFRSNKTPRTLTREGERKVYTDNANANDIEAARLQFDIERGRRLAEDVTREYELERGNDNSLVATRTPRNLDTQLARLVISAYTPHGTKKERSSTAIKTFRENVKDAQAVTALHAAKHYIGTPPPAPRRVVTTRPPTPPPAPPPARRWRWSLRKGSGSKRKVKSKRKAKAKKVRFSRTRRPRRSKRQSRRIRRRKPTPYRSKTNSVYSGTFSPTDVPTD